MSIRTLILSTILGLAAFGCNSEKPSVQEAKQNLEEAQEKAPEKVSEAQKKASENIQQAKEQASKKVSEAEQKLDKAVTRTEDQVESAKKELNQAEQRRPASVESSSAPEKSEEYCRGLEEGGITAEEKELYKGCK